MGKSKLEYFFKDGLRKLIIFGLNELACDAIRFCRNLGVEVMLVSGPRMRKVEFACDGDNYGYRYCIDWVENQSDVEYFELTQLRKIDIEEHLCSNCAGFSFDSPFIIKQPVIDLFDGAIFNEHGAILPHGKGGGGYSWRIMDGDREGSVVFHRLIEEIDGGEIVVQQNFEFSAACRHPIDFYRFQHERNREALQTFLRALYSNEGFELQSQAARFSSYMPRLNTAEQAFIDWNWSAEDVVAFIHAFSVPYEGAKSFLNGRKVFLLDAYVDRKTLHTHPFKRGIIFNVFKGSLYIVANGGTLVVTDFVVEDDDNRIIVGDRLHTPINMLEQAYAQRVIYTPSGLKS